MIAKERNAQEHPETDHFSRAGADAEKQMSHYLLRAFGNDTDIAVFNDLRIVDAAGEVAQFDHLLLHRRGIIVIESKSVTSAVSINEAGEWSREWNGRWDGMPSPIRQAERQMELLKKVLSAHREELREKVLFGKLQKGFNATPFDILVAISDKGRIDRDKNTPSEVHKAEAVVDAVRAIITRHKKGAAGLALNFKDGMEKYTDYEFAAIRNFLAQRHIPSHAPSDSTTKPSPAAMASVSQTTSVGDSSAPYAARSTGATTEAPQPCATPPPQTPSTPATIQQTCPKCQATDLAILYGRFGYYWKCNACAHTADIDRTCPQCGEKAKTRKEGLRFHRDCSKCSTSAHFHTNTEQA